MLPKEISRIVLGLGITSSSLLEKDKPSSGLVSLGPFSTADFWATSWKGQELADA
jgi:hypothetical protein